MPTAGLIQILQFYVLSLMYVCVQLLCTILQQQCLRIGVAVQPHQHLILSDHYVFQFFFFSTNSVGVEWNLTTVLFIYLFLATQRGMRDLSFPTRDGTCTLCSESAES